MKQASARAGSAGRRGRKVEGTKQMRDDNVPAERADGKSAETMGGARKIRARLVAGSSEQRDRRMKLVAKLRAVMINTPADENGPVPETPFTQAGVARVMDLLGQRALKDDTAGGKVAGKMLKFLSADEGDDAVAGASVKKLQAFAARTEKLKSDFGRKLRKS